MRTPTTRKIVFATMLCGVLALGVAYAGSTTSWSGAAFATPGGSFPAPPINLRALASTPVSLLLGWDPDLANGAVPDQYHADMDSVPGTPTTSTQAQFNSLTPGSTHSYTVGAWAYGGPSAPSAAFVFTQPKAALTLGKPSAPRLVKRSKAARYSGTLASSYSPTTGTVVKLKFYRRTTKAGKKVWVLKKTVTVSRPAATTWSLSRKMGPAGSWSVIAVTAGDASHSAATSPRSATFKIK